MKTIYTADGHYCETLETALQMPYETFINGYWKVSKIDSFEISDGGFKLMAEYGQVYK